MAINDKAICKGYTLESRYAVDVGMNSSDGGCDVQSSGCFGGHIVITHVPVRWRIFHHFPALGIMKDLCPGDNKMTCTLEKIERFVP